MDSDVEISFTRLGNGKSGLKVRCQERIMRTGDRRTLIVNCVLLEPSIKSRELGMNCPS